MFVVSWSSVLRILIHARAIARYLFEPLIWMSVLSALHSSMLEFMLLPSSLRALKNLLLIGEAVKSVWFVT